jgi:hypothetical protein
MLELRVQYLDDNATDGSGELSTPAGELIGRPPIILYMYIFYILTVLQIRDVYPGDPTFSIPDP